ncbi:hypothetical protein LPJ55_004616 [Coemansia sp. RSA 990]|nr:hypothetical protein LPJ68_004115 [Coemansia sp. RSA 1086]KAJ1870511.1 hypothetical protein LPJ55_004616 [Coemansia sp. RSA 990]
MNRLVPVTPPPSPPASYTSHSTSYDYNGRLDEIRKTEYPQLSISQETNQSEQQTVFLDHAGSTLCAASHIRAFSHELLTHIPANPHSRHLQSQWTQRKIDHARDRLLEFLGTSAQQYAVVFTANATAAIRLAAELTPVSSNGVFCYTRESHTSVVGLRNLVARQDVNVKPIEFTDIEQLTLPQNTKGTSLLAYPAQCNFSGERFPLDVAGTIAKQYAGSKHMPWWVLVDAAAYAASSPLQLNQYKVGPDFVALSMYKIFGAPTGLGALLIRRSSVPFLRSKGYFGGGTVAGLAFDQQWQVYRHAIESRLEDGTVNFQDIISLHHALDAHKKNYQFMSHVTAHTWVITQYAVQKMRMLCHINGQPVCEIYGHTGKDFGPTISFNIKDPHARYVGYVEVERLAVMAGISLRSGRFCNPGAAQKWLGLSAQDLVKQASLGFVCGDDNDLLDGRPVGALRVSFGAMTSIHDIDMFIAFLNRQFCNHRLSTSSAISKPVSLPSGKAALQSSQTCSVEVEKIVVYPIKSCHGWTVPSDTLWPITQYGLKFDRSFVIMRENSSIPMQQKSYPDMALIRPRIDAESQLLILEAPGHMPLHVSLRPADLLLEQIEPQICSSRVEAVRLRSSKISSWLSAVLSVACYLACEPRLLLESKPQANSTKSLKSFANEAQLLLVTSESAGQVDQWISRDNGKQGVSIGPMQYRPNIIVKSAGAQHIRPFEELQWKSLFIDNCKFNVAGPCQRCQMISIDQDSAKRLKEPYATLARHMRVNGKVVFGIYLNIVCSSTPSIRSGNIIKIK